MRPALRRTSSLFLALALVLAGAACGDDDGADVREIGETESSGPGSGSGVESGSTTGSGSGTADETTTTTAP